MFEGTGDGSKSRSTTQSQELSEENIKNFLNINADSENFDVDKAPKVLRMFFDRQYGFYNAQDVWYEQLRKNSIVDNDLIKYLKPNREA